MNKLINKMKNDIIEGIKIFGDFFELSPLDEIEKKIKGNSIHDQTLFSTGISNYIIGMSDSDFGNLIKK